MGFLMAIFTALVMAVGGYGWYATSDLPPIDTLLAQKQNGEAATQNASQVLANDGRTLIYTTGQFHQQELPLSQVAPIFTDALIATEDRRFYSHNGVDLLGVARATWRNIRGKHLYEGGSTLTQQLVRNMFLTNERSFKRKIREVWLSWQLEGALSKQEILQLYVNTVYFGEGAYGIEAASEIYFSKSASQLSTPEAAMLAGMPQAPSRYSPFVSPDLTLKRRNEVLDNLVEVGKLTPDKAERYKNQGLGLHPASNRLAAGDKVPFFNRQVQQKVMNWFGLSEQEFWQMGFKITTTVDLRAQRLAESAVTQVSRQFRRTGKGQEAAMVLINPSTGAVLAYVGGKDYNQSQYDRVALAKRSPGSLFKVFTYTAAMEKGYLPNDTMVDEPVRFGGWRPENYDHSHVGKLTLAQALAVSNNVIAVKLMNEIGPQRVVDLAHAMGIETELPPYLSLTLGGTSVQLMEMTSAFGSLANAGVWNKPYLIETIEDSDGNTIYTHEPEVRSAISPGAADTMVALLEGVVRFGTGQRAKIGRPMAGKTGTSDKNRDAWFIGFTPEAVAGVWVGNDDNSTMGKAISGGTMPAVLWRTFMSSYLAATPPHDFLLQHTKLLNDPSMDTGYGEIPQSILNGSPGGIPTDNSAPVGLPQAEQTLVEPPSTLDNAPAGSPANPQRFNPAGPSAGPTSSNAPPASVAPVAFSSGSAFNRPVPVKATAKPPSPLGQQPEAGAPVPLPAPVPGQ